MKQPRRIEIVPAVLMALGAIFFMLLTASPLWAIAVDCTPESLSIEPGEEGSYSISVDDITGEFAFMELSPQRIEGVTCEFDYDTLYPPEYETTLRCVADDGTTNFGVNTLTIYAYDSDAGETFDTCSVELEVSAPSPPEEPEEPEEGSWELFIDPVKREIDPGEDVNAKVFADFSGACQGPLGIDIDESTSEYIKDATYMGGSDFNGLDDPNFIHARLGQEALTSGDSDSTLDLKVGGNVPAGVYQIKVEGTSDDEACGNDDQTVVLELFIGEVNVLLEKSQSKSELKPGMTQVYTLNIDNENSPELTNLVITDTLDGRLEYESDTSGKTPTVTGNTYTWEFNDLGRGERIEFQVKTVVDEFAREGSSISNRFTVTADQLPEAVVSNTVTATMGYVSSEPDDLRVTKRLLAGRPRIGAILTYRVEVENEGGGPVFGVRLYDDPAHAFKIIKGKSLRDGKLIADPVLAGGKYVWNLGHLAPGARTVVTYQMAIGTNADSGKNENCAEAVGRDGGGKLVKGSDCVIVRLDGGDLEWLGQITAKAYLDVDNNGMRNAADEPLEGAEFILVGGDRTGLKQITGRDGETVFAELESGSYVLALDTRKLDRKHRFEDTQHTELVRLLEGDKAEILFLIKKIPEYSKLVGRVFYDDNNNRKYDTSDLLADFFTAILDSRIRTDGRGGAFIFSRLEPGPHVLVITQGDQEMTEVELDLTEGENRIDIPLIRPRLRITIESGGDH